jgi:hypothetical protein
MLRWIIFGLPDSKLKKDCFSSATSRSFRNSVQTNRGQEPRTHELWGVGPLQRWRRQTFCKLSLSTGPSALCWPATPPSLPPPSSLPANHLRPPTPPHRGRVWGHPGNGDHHGSTSVVSLLWQRPQSASIACFLRRGTEDGGNSCRQKEKWKPSYGFIPNGWRQKESIKKERKTKNNLRVIE